MAPKKHLKESLVIGIDAGNTKTTIALADENLQTLQTVKGPAGGISGNDIESSVNSILSNLRKIRIARSSIGSIHLGIAGVDSQKTLDKVFKRLKKELPGIKLSVSNDILLALKSGTDRLPAIALIAGTGTNVLGVAADGRTAKVSGLNWVISDEGSGYWIGKKILEAAVRSADGRTKKSALEKIVLKHFNIKKINELPEQVFALKNHKREIAQLSRYLTDALIKKDTGAKKIADKAAEELALCVTAAASRLKLTQKEFDLVMVGGVIRNKKYIQNKFRRMMKTSCPKTNFILPECKPVIGALKIAWENIYQR